MKWFRIGLEVIGASSLLFFGVVAAWTFHNSTSERVNTAKRKDVLFVLNWGGVSTNQDFKIIASYQSPRSFTGDHLDYYCIELSKFEVSDYEKNDWHDGPEQNPLLADALELSVNDARQHGDCFPSADEANSATMKIMFWSVELHGRQPTSADIILYNPKNKRLYYVSYKT
jgi:hypothetical protein